MKFLALNSDCSNSCLDPQGLRRPALVNEGYPLKSGYFTAIRSTSVKQLQICTDMLLIITSTSNEVLNGVNINDLK